MNKEIISETNLGEYGIYKSKKVPLDLPILNESEVGSRGDVVGAGSFSRSVSPYSDLLRKIKADHGAKSQLWIDAASAVLDKDAEELKTVLRDYGVLFQYEHLLGLNENTYHMYVRNPKTKKIQKITTENTIINNPKQVINEIKTLREDSASKLYKVEGLLVTNNDIKWQKEVISDIRSITGVTTIDAREYTPRIRKKNYSYDRVTVKVDPYPYLKHGKFDLDTLKQVIQNINNIKGIVKFKVDNPQMLNIGV